MLKVPERNSLIAQTVEALRDGLARGEWTTALPGERALCDRLQISRPTLRLALEVLETEGLIQTSHGKRRLIVGRQARAKSGRGAVVGLVSETPPHLMAPTTIFYMNELRKHLQEAGLQLQVFANKRFASRKPTGALVGLEEETNVACWVLISANEPVQRWFAKRQLPALVAGSVYPGVNLPSLDLDYAATCRHAAGVFFRHGHRRMAILLPDFGTAGDRNSEGSFLRAIEGAGHPDARGVAFRHDGTRETIVRLLNRMFRAKHPPTGLLVCRPLHVLTVLTALMNRGLKIPDDVSLISRDNDNYLGCLEPDIARYTYKRRHFAQRLSRLVIQLATTGSLPKRDHRLIPQLHAGASVSSVSDVIPRHAPGRSS